MVSNHLVISSAGRSNPPVCTPRASAKIAGERIAIGQRAVAVRDRVEQEGGVEHVVVEREVVARHDVRAGFALQAPMGVPQLRGGLLQLPGVEFAAPVAFQRGLQFAFRADAREAEIRNESHWMRFLMRDGQGGTKEPRAAASREGTHRHASDLRPPSGDPERRGAGAGRRARAGRACAPALPHGSSRSDRDFSRAGAGLRARGRGTLARSA